jgi:hypothetical protein
MSENNTLSVQSVTEHTAALHGFSAAEGPTSRHAAVGWPLPIRAPGKRSAIPVPFEIGAS